MSATTITYRGLSGVRITLNVDTTDSLTTITNAAIADEGFASNYYADFFLLRDGSIKRTTDGSSTYADLALTTADELVAVLADDPTTFTKQQRQTRKLEIAQLKRRGGPDADTGANFYRTNNTYDITSLPDTYNANVPGVDDNPNTGGLIQKRPWVAVGAIAAPTSIQESVDGGSITDLEIWYDGADTDSIVPTGIADEANINQWNDKSGLAHNLNFSGGANKATYESSDAQNGYGYVQFDDGDLMSINPLASLSGATAFTVFVIARSTDLATNATQILTSTENAELSIQIDTNGTARFKVGASAATTASGTVQVNEWNIYTLVYSGTSNIVGRVNDGKLPSQTIVSAGAVAGPATMGASTYLYVGGDNTGGTFIGDVGEVIIFRKALSSIEYANVENYLATKWGI